LRFSGSVTVYDKNDEDTLWIRVYYTEFERQEIDLTLKKIYSLLHSDGNLGIIKFLNVDSIDYALLVTQNLFE
jgi:molybdopterin/thiamine biosynthesis adenylyltransferase